jgi:5-formyltetrahydrofolate cyclo-ligase
MFVGPDHVVTFPTHLTEVKIRCCGLSPMRAAKNELRQRMRALRLGLTAGEAARRSALAAAHVLALPELRVARVVALYAPIIEARELDTAPLHDALVAAGKRVVYPRVRGRERPLELHAVTDPTELVVSALGIPQPQPTAPIAELSSIELFVIPGLAFGEGGERVGWGAGHYDRTLALAREAVRVGYAYDFQVVAALPQNADDERMDLVVTDTGARARARRSP